MFGPYPVSVIACERVVQLFQVGGRIVEHTQDGVSLLTLERDGEEFLVEAPLDHGGGREGMWPAVGVQGGDVASDPSRPGSRALRVAYARYERRP